MFKVSNVGGRLPNRRQFFILLTLLGQGVFILFVVIFLWTDHAFHREVRVDRKIVYANVLLETIGNKDAR